MMDRNQIYLMVQRAALKRAIQRARECRADDDAEVLQTIVHLLEELYELAAKKTH